MLFKEFPFAFIICLWIGSILAYSWRLSTTSTLLSNRKLHRSLSSEIVTSRYHITSLFLSNEDNQRSLNFQSKAKELRSKLKGTNVYFVGLMGSGKSTVGKEFATMLEYRFLDTDEIAEYMIEMPISKFFELGKMDEFRQVEYQILMEMAQYTRLVLATGGGVVEKNENWGQLRYGLVVFLDMTPEDIYNRLIQVDPIQIQKRPLLAGLNPLQKLQELYDRRREKYQQADIHVKVLPNQEPSVVAENTITAILDFIQFNPPMWEHGRENAITLL